MRFDVACPTCGGDVAFLALRESNEHLHSVIGRCSSCALDLAVTLRITEHRQIHHRNLRAPYAGLVDLIDAAADECPAPRRGARQRAEGARLA